MIDSYKSARTIALTVFRRNYTEGADYTAVLEKALAAALGLEPEVDSNQLREDLETAVNITVDLSRRLTDPTDHVPWLHEKKGSISWRFWERYRDYLLHERRLPLRVVERLDEVTDDILGLLEDPAVKGRTFDTRGLVMGQVQSGKTTNYSALINKCIDAGYKLVIVLAGMHNNLRSQTQVRLDEEVLGFDTAKSLLSAHANGRFGVGAMLGAELLAVGSLTSWDEQGDFRATIARSVSVQPGALPLVLVVKKNGTVLRNLIRYFRDASPSARLDSESGLNQVHDVPLLVIDDEADQASVNTKQIARDDDGRPLPDYDTTVINQRIRELLRCFTQSAYVGYTATPFANVFIHNDAAHRVYGEDLFPRSFILTLAPPANYVGPARLLGGKDPNDQGQPIFRPAEDGGDMVPDGHDRRWVPPSLAPSLQDALRAFLLSCAARRARGQLHEHNSMLIHVTRFQDVQTRLADLVRDELNSLKNRLRWGDGADRPTLRDELRELWERDFRPTTISMDGADQDWRDIETELDDAADLMRIRIINGRSDDLLDYRQHADTGVNIVAVGGDKLSRGLTLEGLTVSYFLRASKMYDTLMQMGRWFGYRDGYEDLCRIYTTEELLNWFRHIASASEELREEFDYMASVGATPREFGLRVRSHPVLTVTSRVKMREGEELSLTYEGDISETTAFDRDQTALDRNFSATDGFLRGLGDPTREEDRRLIWEAVPSDEVIQYLHRYSTSADAPRANSARLAAYIEAQNHLSEPELTHWTVVLVSQAKRKGVRETWLAGREVTCIQRTATRATRESFSIKRLISPADEELDLSDAERRQATEETMRIQHGDAWQSAPEPDQPSGRGIRAARPKTRGLLLIYPLDPDALFTGKFLSQRGHAPPPPTQAPIGLALSFPGSRSAVRVRYVVNRVWQQDEDSL